jgi:hypothetical protein
LLGPELDALIAHAGAAFDTRVITNGYWAMNEDSARKRVADLRAAGLDEIVFSTGTFHQRYVPLRRVLHGARAATAAGIPTRIAIETCDQSRVDEDLVRAELREALASGVLTLSNDPWTTDAGGRGSVPITHERLRSSGRVQTAGGCIAAMTTLSVTPDQRLVACCGFPLEELPGLAIGSVAERALDDVLREAPNDLLKMFLHVAGPTGIAEFIARYDPGYVLPQNPVSICEACVALQRDSRAMRIAADHAPEIADAVFQQFVTMQNAFELPRPSTLQQHCS